MECWKIFLGILCLIIAFAYQKFQKLSKNLPIPNFDLKVSQAKPVQGSKFKLCSNLNIHVFDLKEFWGKGDVANYKEDSSIKPFKVSFGDEVS